MPRTIAFLVSAGLVATLILSVLWFQELKLLKPQTLTVRQITIATPPPKPPPPLVKKNQFESTMSINITANGAGPAMKFAEVKLPQQMDLSELSPPNIEHMKGAFVDNLSVDWQAFGLSELDDVPRLLTNLKISYPTSLVRKGIHRIDVELDVLIDESGKVVLRRIVRNPHPEFESIIQKLMKKARFTAPKKNGVPVRAAFNWPLEFSHS
ncbi:MAG: energy transducer TonB [Kangiellaceae bacterium]|nr:energy transducer TonB [Kangiellaceae bacterium]